MDKAHWNQKVAKNRGLEWRKKLLSGRLHIQMNPTTVRLKRIKKNMTQIEIAKLIGMSYTTYGAVESGRRPVLEPMAQKIAQVLDLPFTKKIFTLNKKGGNRYVAVKG